MRRLALFLLFVLMLALPAKASDRVALLPPFGVPIDSQVSQDLYFLLSDAFSKQGYLVLPRDEVIGVLSAEGLLKVLKNEETVSQKIAKELYQLGYSKDAIKYTTGESFSHTQAYMRFLMPLYNKKVAEVGKKLGADIVKIFIYRHGTVFVPSLLAIFPVDLSKPDLLIPAIFNMQQGVSAVAIYYYHADKLIYGRYAIASFRGTVSGKKEFLSFTALREAVKKLFKKERK